MCIRGSHPKDTNHTHRTLTLMAQATLYKPVNLESPNLAFEGMNSRDLGNFQPYFWKRNDLFVGFGELGQYIDYRLTIIGSDSSNFFITGLSAWQDGQLAIEIKDILMPFSWVEAFENVQPLSATGIFGADVISSMSSMERSKDHKAYDDEFEGSHGDDLLFGHEGRDFIKGNTGDDILSGGVGSDSVIGGDGFNIYLSEDDGFRDNITVENDGQADSILRLDTSDLIHVPAFSDDIEVTPVDEGIGILVNGSHVATYFGDNLDVAQLQSIIIADYDFIFAPRYGAWIE